MTEYRAHFDADVEFANGARVTAEGFRLDLPSRDLSDEQIAELFVWHLSSWQRGSAVVAGLRPGASRVV